MACGVLILFLGISVSFAEETPPNIPNLSNLQALLPLLNEPLQTQTDVYQQTSQSVLQKPNQYTEPNAVLGDRSQVQALPVAYSKLFESTVNNNYGPKCPPTNIYASVPTLLQIFGVLLEFLNHSSESEKAYVVSELMKKYLLAVPSSQEKNAFLMRLKNVENHLLNPKESAGDYSNEYFTHPPHVHKTTIVFQKELPGTNQQNCRDTLGRLIQTAVNVYKETAKHPQCLPTGYVDENLYHPNLPPQKPYQFVVVYHTPLTSNYVPDYSGLSLLPDLNLKHPHLGHVYPPPVPGHNLNYPFLPDGQNPNSQSLPAGQNYQLLPNGKNPNLPSSLIGQNTNSIVTYEQNPSLQSLLTSQNPNYPHLPTDQNVYLPFAQNVNPDLTKNPLAPKTLIQELLKNFTARPSNDYSSSSSYYPNPDLKAHFPTYNPSLNDNSAKQKDVPSLYPDLLLEPNSNPFLVPQNPDLKGSAYLVSNNGYYAPGLHKVPPNDKLYQEYNEQVVPDVLVNALKPGTQNNPELTLEILLSLLGHPEGAKTQLKINPALKKLLLEYLYLNQPAANQEYFGYKPDSRKVQEDLAEYLNQLYPDAYGNVTPDYASLKKQLQQWLAVTNGNKLLNPHNTANAVELTYALKRPQPLIYRPIYYVKYRLPYQSFIQNFQNLILKKPGLRSDPERLYQELVAVSNISDVSPGLRRFGKEDILKLVFGDGTLVDAKVVGVPDSDLNARLVDTLKMNAEVDPEVIEKLSGKLGITKSENNKEGPYWPRQIEALKGQSFNHVAEIVQSSSKSPISQATKENQSTTPKPSLLAKEGSYMYSNQVLGLPNRIGTHLMLPQAYTKAMDE